MTHGSVSVKKIYLALAILGTLVPCYFLVSFLLDFGLDPGLLIQQLFANDISTFFAVDLIISSLVFWLFAYREAQALDIPRWWVSIVANLLVGLSLSLPLFLYLREDALERQGG